MAIAPIPQNFNVQTANGQVLLTWNFSTGATTYDVQRSVDNITYASVSTPAVNQYLDTSVTLSTQYYYKIAAINADGTSAYTSAQSAVPTTSGEKCLSQIRLEAQQRADRVNSNFVGFTEWNAYINQSLFELYDLLVTVYEDYFVAEPATINTNGTDYQYTLPNGVLTFKNQAGSDFVPQPFYKLIGVDLGVNTANNAWVTMRKFNFVDRNRYVYPNSSSTIYGVFNLQYRILGDKIEFIPCPAPQQIRLWYIPRLRQLLQDADTTTSGISGWLEYVIVDAAIKALQKEESDVSVLMAQKMALKERIESTAPNRDAGMPDTISDVSNTNGWGTAGPFSGSRGGW